MGKVFDNLTKPGVSVDGKTSYYDNKGDATKAMVQAAAKTAQPSTSTLGGTVDDSSVPTTTLPSSAPDFTQTLGGDVPGLSSPAAPSTTMASLPNDNVTTGFSSPSIDPNSIPKSANQSFLAPTDPNRPLSTKGEILKLVLAGLTGAAVGAGRRTLGEGAVAGAQNEMQAERTGLENRMTQAQIDNLPMLRAIKQAELNETNARTGYYNDRANRAEFVNTKNGTLQIGPHGQNLGIIPGTGPQEKPDLLETVDGRKTFLSNLKEQYGKDYSFTPREEQEFQANGKIPVSGKSPDQMSPVELSMRSVMEPDPQKRALYKQALDAYGSTVRPNNAGTNEQTKFDRDKDYEGEVGGVSAAAMNQSGQDEQKAITMLRQRMSGQGVSARSRAVAQDAIKSLESSYRAKQAGKKGGSPLDILNSVLNPQPVPAH